MKVRSEIPTAENTTNMDGFGTCEVGTTLENLKAAIGGETGASAKYAAFAQAAKEQGYEQIARLFEATSAAEQIHIGLEYALVAEVAPDFEKPAAPEAEGVQTDLNLIMGAQGEIFETSDMYPAFIKKAQEELQTAFYAVAERIYKEQGAAAQQAEAAQTDVQGEGTNAAGGSDDNVVDADYTDAN